MLLGRPVAFADGEDSVHPGHKAIPKYVVSTTLTDDDLVDSETTISLP